MKSNKSLDPVFKNTKDDVCDNCGGEGYVSIGTDPDDDRTTNCPFCNPRVDQDPDNMRDDRDL